MDIQEINQPFSISSFSGGMRRDIDPADLAENQYTYAQNLRVRNGPLQCVREPLDVSAGLNSTGNLQGHYQVGDLRLVFIDGIPYGRDLSDVDAIYNRIGSQQLNPFVSRIYIQVVPKSLIDFKRETNTEEASSPIKYTEPSTGTDAGILCQDGVSRPILILDNLTTRNAQDIGDWSDEDREYVPIGLMMLYYDDILYMVSPDKKELYRSVTGRPLDFVIAVDQQGLKLADRPANGNEASRLSYKVDNSDITSLQAITLTQQLINRLPQNNPSGFFVGTTGTSYIVTPNYDDTLYGEPTFSNRPLFPTSPINNFVNADLLGDTGFVDATGLKSIEEILASGNEGANLNFAKSLDFYFSGRTKVTQDENLACAGVYDNYAMFFVTTRYGQRVIVFDTLNKVFVSIDDYSSVIDGSVKSFASGILSNKERVVSIATDTGKIYDLDVSSQGVLPWQFFTKEWTVGDMFAELKPSQISITTQDAQETGDIVVNPIVDRITQNDITDTIDAIEGSINPTPPFDNPTESSVSGIDYGIIDCPAGTKVAFKVSSDIDVTLYSATLDCIAVLNKISLLQMGKAYGN